MFASNAVFAAICRLNGITHADLFISDADKARAIEKQLADVTETRIGAFLEYATDLFTSQQRVQGLVFDLLNADAFYAIWEAEHRREVMIEAYFQLPPSLYVSFCIYVCSRLIYSFIL